MKVSTIAAFLESLADPTLQETYDNAGLLTGDPDWEVSGIICCLDAVEEVIDEAINKNCNLVIAHHPIIFGGLKKINGKNYVERAVIKSIKNDVAIYAIHTNLDNVLEGVNGRMADIMGLQQCSILQPKANTLKKIYTFVPTDKADQVRQALFQAGAGVIGRYSECSFNTEGMGTFKANQGADPFVGKIGETHQEKELRLEIIFPAQIEQKLVTALKAAHPYEEVAYDIVSLSNTHPGHGTGLIGDLQEPLPEAEFLSRLKRQFNLHHVRHTAQEGRDIQKVAICGGAGSFLISKALAAGAHAFVTADLKYHEFFDGDGRLLVVDIGHYESEQFTINLLHEVLEQKFPTFAVLKTGVNTNPVRYS